MSWDEQRALVTHELAEMRSELDQYGRGLQSLGTLTAQVKSAIDAASGTRPIGQRIITFQLQIDQICQQITSITADLTLLKSVVIKDVNKEATDKVLAEKKIAIDVENTRGRWLVIGLIVSNVVTLLIALLKP